MEELGTSMVLVGFALRGEVLEGDCENLINRLVEEIGMTRYAGSTILKYPVEGKGGYGFTYFQPITESFIAVDTYEKLNGIYLIICSCKAFSLKRVLNVLDEFRLEIIEMSENRLGLGYGELQN